jgi:hypothetical protein
MSTQRMVRGDGEHVVRNTYEDVDVDREDGWTVVPAEATPSARAGRAGAVAGAARPHPRVTAPASWTHRRLEPRRTFGNRAAMTSGAVRQARRRSIRTEEQYQESASRPGRMRVTALGSRLPPYPGIDTPAATSGRT